MRKRTKGARLALRRVGLWLVLLSMVNLTACGGKTTQRVETAHDADVGAVITSHAGFEVTLLGAPEKVKVVGGLMKGGQGWEGEQRRWGTEREAKGTWLILPVKLVNQTQDVDMLTRGIFTVKDAQGRESAATGRPEHMMKVFSDDRWGSMDNYLIENPMDPGLAREGPLIFDVAEDATGLRLVAKGTEESFGLGF